METEPGTTRLSVIGISWLTAAIAAPLALIGAVLGQAAGALVGGCHWIGFTVPLDRQIWALVNQPVLNFSSLPDASGYWLGSMLLPLVTGAAVIGFLPRARSLVAELGSVQVAWAMSAISVAWLPLLDPTDGHLARYLALNNRPRVGSGWHLPWPAPSLFCQPSVYSRWPAGIDPIFLAAPAFWWWPFTSVRRQLRLPVWSLSYEARSR
jgi:hypothetical protein